ncbi:MAG: Lpg1974 family pore-forming outer membrane protein [Chlamydiota bacterium]
MKLRKLLPLMGALCACLCVSAQAETRCDIPPPPKPKPACPKPCPPPKGTYQRGMYREITPNAGPRVSCGADVFLTADYILWKLTQDGMVAAETGYIETAGTDATKGTELTPGFKFKSGFKVGLGLNLAHDGWDLFAEYTWLRSSTSDSISERENLSINLPGQRITISASEKVTNRQKHRYNVINLELGRNFYVSQFLMLRPHFGLSGTWQKVRWRVDHRGNDLIGLNNLDINFQNGDLRKRNRNKYWGIGIRGGFDTAWHFTTQWSIFADIAWTAMWSSYDLNRKVTFTGTEIVNNNEAQVDNRLIQYTSPSKFYRVKFVGEFDLGVRWEMWFYDDNYHFAIQVGWSETVWINHMAFTSRFQRFEDMSLHGLDVKFRFDF